MWIIGIKSGIITILSTTAYALMVQLSNMQPTFLDTLGNIWLAVGIYSGHYYYKRAHNNFMNYPQGICLGLIISTFVGLCYVLCIYGYSKMYPSWHAQLTTTIQQSLHQTGGNTSLIQYLSLAGLLTSIFMSTVLLGLVYTLVITIYTRRTSTVHLRNDG